MKVMWVDEDKPKFDQDNQVILGTQVADKSVQVQNVIHKMPFVTCDFASLLHTLLDPRVCRALDQIRNVRTRAELDMEPAEP